MTLSRLVHNHNPYRASGHVAGQKCEMGPHALENISFKERTTTPKRFPGRMGWWLRGVLVLTLITLGSPSPSLTKSTPVNMPITQFTAISVSITS